MMECPACSRALLVKRISGGCPHCLLGMGVRVLTVFKQLIRGSQLAASTMDKSDLVISSAGSNGSVSRAMGLELVGAVEAFEFMTLLPVCFRPPSDFAGRPLQMEFGFASESFRIWQVRKGNPQLDLHVSRLPSAGWADFHLANHPPQHTLILGCHP